MIDPDLADRPDPDTSPSDHPPGGALPADTARGAGAVAKGGVGPGASPDTRRLRVLLVDDDVEACWALATLLQLDLGCEVRTAGSASEAIDEACSLRPHVVVLDLCMPGVDGLETAALLQRMLPTQQPLLIALTGLDTRGDRERVLASGFHAHLGKPVDLGTLEALLRNAASHVRA